jgi:hypothetical protein
MTASFRIRLMNQHQLSDPEVLARVWRHLDSPVVAPTKFDSVERARREFSADAVSEAAELFDRDLHLFVLGANDDFLAAFTRPRPNLSIWNLWLDADAMKGDRGEKWLAWVFELCAELPVLYGFGCTDDEYQEKHATKREAKRGGHITGGKGASISSFFKYLPGVYWLTIFGPELVHAFSAAKLSGLSGAQAHRIGSDQIAIQLDEPPVPDDMGARLRKDAELATELGAEFFFDPERDPAELRQVRELSKALEERDG